MDKIQFSLNSLNFEDFNVIFLTNQIPRNTFFRSEPSSSTYNSMIKSQRDFETFDLKTSFAISSTPLLPIASTLSF